MGRGDVVELLGLGFWEERSEGNSDMSEEDMSEIDWSEDSRL